MFRVFCSICFVIGAVLMVGTVSATVTESETAQQVNNKQRVDLNAASAEAIAGAYKGFGKVRAQAIVQERQANGPFQTLDALSRVPGISAKYVAKHRQALEDAYALGR